MSHEIASERLLWTDLDEADLEPTDLWPELLTAERLLAEHRGVQVGIWAAGPGVGSDVEVDEVFVVLAGEGSVTFEDGSRIDLRPGVSVQLKEGDRTTWDITKRLTKLYVI